jgi:hypothetical protein
MIVDRLTAAIGYDADPLDRPPPITACTVCTLALDEPSIINVR